MTDFFLHTFCTLKRLNRDSVWKVRIIKTLWYVFVVCCLQKNTLYVPGWEVSSWWQSPKFLSLTPPKVGINWCRAEVPENLLPAPRMPMVSPYVSGPHCSSLFPKPIGMVFHLLVPSGQLLWSSSYRKGNWDMEWKRLAWEHQVIKQPQFLGLEWSTLPRTFHSFSSMISSVLCFPLH